MVHDTAFRDSLSLSFTYNGPDVAQICSIKI